MSYRRNHSPERWTRRPGGVVVCLLAALAANARLGAQDDEKAKQKELAEAEREVYEAAKQIGPWDAQVPIIDEATNNFFRQQNWTSEPDRFVLQVVSDAQKIPPWKPMERGEVALNAFQSRWKLTHDQRIQLDQEFTRESMMLAARHVKDIMPVVMEIAKTRAANEPFTAEQVQRWTRRLEPVMDEGMDVFDRVVRKIEKSMTEDQRALMRRDVDAFLRRHRDMVKLFKKWGRGDWSPQDWGLQNDPIHAASMAAHRAEQARRAPGAGAAQTPARAFDETAVVTRETEWERYVRWFCDYFECDPQQRTQADAILKSSMEEAIRYRVSKRDEIERAESIRAAAADNPAKKDLAQAELDRLLAPISEIFNRMKKRLHAQVLTSRQRSLIKEDAIAKPDPGDRKPSAPAQ